MITSSLSGTTHDSIEIDFVWNNYKFTIVDTAGMRKKAKIKEELEYKFVGSSLQAIKLTNIAVLVLDSSEELNKQDDLAGPNPYIYSSELYNRILQEDINKELDLHSHTHSSSSIASILLYTPSNNKFTTQANYENAETGFLSDFLGGTNLVDSLTTGVASAVTKLTAAAITTALEVIVPGAGCFGISSTGAAQNPNLEIAFKSVPFRPFNFEYKLAPKNKKELDQVHKIIQLFRFHMSPSLLGKTQYFASPSQFMITYCYRVSETNDDSHNSYIPKIAKCVLENLEVDYSPGEKYTTLKPDDQGASPQVITMTMQFKEMSIITKETIGVGY